MEATISEKSMILPKRNFYHKRASHIIPCRNSQAVTNDWYRVVMASFMPVITERIIRERREEKGDSLNINLHSEFEPPAVNGVNCFD